MSKNIGFFPAHPSQLWMMKALYDSAPSYCNIYWFIREKDIMVPLIEHMGLSYQLVSTAGAGLLGNASELLVNIMRFLYLTRKYNINLWLSKYGSVNIASWILRCKNISFNDDDADVVPFIALTSYPFAQRVLCTEWTRMGRYERYAKRYASFHELFYLHPKRFAPDLDSARKALNLESLTPYVIVRLSSLQAHHDVSEKGVSDMLLDRIIAALNHKYKIYISSERPLKSRFELYRLKIHPANIHNVLAFAGLVVGDSQTMIAEAAVLGVPGLRISTFAGRLGYLDELERRGLCTSALPSQEDKIMRALENLMSIDRFEMTRRRDSLLQDTVDPVDFFWDEVGRLIAK